MKFLYGTAAALVSVAALFFISGEIQGNQSTTSDLDRSIEEMNAALDDYKEADRLCAAIDCDDT